MVANRVAALAHSIVGVALDGVHTAIFHAFHNAYMVGVAVLPTGCPIEKNEVAGARLIVARLP